MLFAEASWSLVLAPQKLSNPDEVVFDSSLDSSTGKTHPLLVCHVHYILLGRACRSVLL